MKDASDDTVMYRTKRKRIHFVSRHIGIDTVYHIVRKDRTKLDTVQLIA
jgi:hypothetical protein